MRICRRILCLVSLAALVLAASASSASALPRINHVFVIVLENKNYDESFGPGTKVPYLARTLAAKGALLARYYGIAHESNSNYLAMISGQSPNADTQADCQFFSDFAPGTPTSNGQVIGQGCVYPFGTVQTIANQLEDHGYTWKGYMEGMANSKPPGGSPNCVHPAINAKDNTQTATATKMYAVRHNPFVYFHSLIDRLGATPDRPSSCERNDVPYTRLARNLTRASRTPTYSFIVPNLCHDGHDEPCKDGKPGGLPQVNKWLKANVPPILQSPAYHDGGLLLITFDEAESPPDASPSDSDGTACCNEQPGPNTINPAGPIPGPGGGRVGAVALSPCIRPSQVFTDGFNHYSMLRSIEDLFRLQHLGFAAQAGLDTFNSKIFRRSPCPNVAAG
jgi:phospholipase C